MICCSTSLLLELVFLQGLPCTYFPPSSCPSSLTGFLFPANEQHPRSMMLPTALFCCTDNVFRVMWSVVLCSTFLQLLQCYLCLVFFAPFPLGSACPRLYQVSAYLECFHCLCLDQANPFFPDYVWLTSKRPDTPTYRVIRPAK